MPLTKKERQEINEAIKSSMLEVTRFLEENRGSPIERAQYRLVDRAGREVLGGLEAFANMERPRGRDITGADLILGTALDEGLLLATQPKQRRKRKSQFNKAVSFGMKAVRKSKYYGKAGTINNAKRAFSAVTKTASKINKGKKVSTKGVTGTIARAIRGIFK
jgi:hypothetical protein